MQNSRKRSNIFPLEVDPRASNALKYREQEDCDLVVHRAREGHFPEQWCAEMGISMATFYSWADRYPEFDRAVRIAWTALSAFWTAEIVSVALGKKEANVKVLLELLRRRFPDTWGANARGTFEHYDGLQSRGKSGPKPDQKHAHEFSEAELRAELEALLAERGDTPRSPPCNPPHTQQSVDSTGSERRNTRPTLQF
ncbi:hypothetical protein KUV47_09130 [Vannielia litorea]|uniref:hypothetical protein n=1 Tax=Vannielia litorea TaxID=1217970 RepID=UPI001C9460FA|nr:hypothetical protein [Vannielia litorea]MBY6153373.1 hypothetical protein [Vannielia litorea]